jgi:GNAT superfamily N-acetyltransferase
MPVGSIEDGSVTDIAVAEEWLKSQGCTHARGPMGASTWTPYRAVLETDGRPRFFNEPCFEPSVWLESGYVPCAHYASALADNIDQMASAQSRSKELFDAGWTIKGLDAHRSFDEALQCFHRVSTVAFADAFSYTSIPYATFHHLYGSIQPHLEPDLVLTAFTPRGDVAGFCFAIPDRLNPDRREFIIKTLAVLPEYREAGVGSCLVGMAHTIAHRLGWTHGGIHALMWETSHSRSISKHAGQIFRRYALYEKAL